MQNNGCVTCLKPKTHVNCDVCNGAICKSCAQFLNEDSFSFLEKIPESLSHNVYCGACFDQNVRPEMENYDKTMEAAKNVLVYAVSKSKETSRFSRKEDLFRVIDCTDHNEAILRLAFYAAKAKFNAIIDLEISSKKVRNASYQHLLWSASARPTNVN